MARRKPPQIHGFLIIDKPAGCTSHDVVDQVRRRLGERRVGHAGTLDPDATGVMLIGVGSATRLMRFMDLVNRDGRMVTEKSYTGEVVLGSETTSLDASGDVTASHDMAAVIERINHDDGMTFVQAVIDANLVGDIMQVPPMVSAIRVDGRRLHELAREGIEVEREARPVNVSRFAVTGIHGNVVSIDVTCSSGTFIRTLAADLGRLLGGGAHLRNLRRTAVGAFSIDEAQPIDEAPLLPVAVAVRGLSALTLSGDDETSMRQLAAVGKVLPVDRFSDIGPEPWAVIAGGDVLAIYESFSNAKVGDGMARPTVSLSTPAVS